MGLFSVGHSTYTTEELRVATQDCHPLVDVRSHPVSSHCPQFCKEQLELSFGDKYKWKPGLGGWVIDTPIPPELRSLVRRHVDVDKYAEFFPKHHIAKTIEPTKPARPEWLSVGLRDYSWYMILPVFLEAADDLLRLSKTDNPAIMCAEALWFKCHRSMIADYASYRGVDTTHILVRQRKSGKYNGYKQHNAVINDRPLRYDLEIVRQWDRWAQTHPL